MKNIILVKRFNISNLMISLISLFLVLLLAGCGNGSNNVQDTKPVNTENSNQNTDLNNESANTGSVFDVSVNDNPKFGKILTDGSGMTLYTYTKDTKNNTVCYDTCAVNWPPLTVGDIPSIDTKLVGSKFSTITRTDGSKQVTFEGAPLYYWINDKTPGDTTGEGVGGVWYVYRLGNDDIVN